MSIVSKKPKACQQCQSYPKHVNSVKDIQNMSTVLRISKTCQQCQRYPKHVDSVKDTQNMSTVSKILKHVDSVENTQNMSTVSKIPKTCQVSKISKTCRQYQRYPKQVNSVHICPSPWYLLLALGAIVFSSKVQFA